MGIIAGIAALMVVIAVHELGHFLMAKAAKVGVRTFSIGIGPKLFAIRYRQTVYRLAAIPVGGYVALRDETPETDLVGDEWAAPSIPAGTRALISIAGPLANLLLAAFLVVGLAPFVDPPYRSRISPSTDTWTPPTRQELAGAPQRKSGTRRRDTTPNPIVIPAEIDQVTAGSLAEAAGLQRGDRILAINHKWVTGWGALARHIRRSPGRQVTLTIERDGRRLFVDLVPLSKRSNDLGLVWIGIAAFPDPHDKRVDIFTAFVQGIGELVLMIRVMLSFIGELIRGEIPLTSIINGPLSFIWMVSEAVAAGVENLRYLVAYFSFGMAVVNLLPIPLLDGGQCLFAVFEAVRCKPCSQRTRMIASHLGLGLVGVLGLLAVWSDLVWLFGGR